MSIKFDATKFKSIRFNNRIIGLGLSLLLLSYRLIIQPIISVREGRGWDGSVYFTMASDLHSQTPLPFSLRIGLPILVHYLPGSDILLKFKIINIIFSIIFSYLCYVGISKLTSSPFSRLTAWLLICATEVSPIMISVWYPINSDVIPNLLLLILVILTYIKKKDLFLYMIFLFAFGTIFRENFPIFLVILLINLNFESESSLIKFVQRNFRKNLNIITNIVGGLIGSTLGLLTIYQFTGFSPFSGKSGTFINTLIERNFVETVAAFTITFGPLLLFIIASRINPISNKERTSSKTTSKFAIFLLTLIALGGGSNTERFLYWVLIILVFEMIPTIEFVFTHARLQNFFVFLLFILVLQHVLIPIAPGGIAGCDIKSYFIGNQTFLGHWTQICSPLDSLNIILAYLIIFGIFFLLYFFLDVANRKMNMERYDSM